LAGPAPGCSGCTVTNTIVEADGEVWDTSPRPSQHGPLGVLYQAAVRANHDPNDPERRNRGKTCADRGPEIARQGPRRRRCASAGLGPSWRSRRVRPRERPCARRTNSTHHFQRAHHLCNLRKGARRLRSLAAW
jgi:hypothetical protein